MDVIWSIQQSSQQKKKREEKSFFQLFHKHTLGKWENLSGEKVREDKEREREREASVRDFSGGYKKKKKKKN